MIITLKDGTQVDVSQINFDTSSYHFYYGDEDVTDLISFADKENNWPNFDPRTDAERVYNEKVVPTQGGTVVPLSYANNTPGTSTAGNLYGQLTTDPLAAPLQAADKITANTISTFLKSTTVWVVVALIGLGLYLRVAIGRK